MWWNPESINSLNEVQNKLEETTISWEKLFLSKWITVWVSFSSDGSVILNASNKHWQAIWDRVKVFNWKLVETYDNSESKNFKIEQWKIIFIWNRQTFDKPSSNEESQKENTVKETRDQLSQLSEEKLDKISTTRVEKKNINMFNEIRELGIKWKLLDFLRPVTVLWKANDYQKSVINEELNKLNDEKLKAKIINILDNWWIQL